MTMVRLACTAMTFSPNHGPTNPSSDTNAKSLRRGFAWICWVLCLAQLIWIPLCDLLRDRLCVCPTITLNCYFDLFCTLCSGDCLLEDLEEPLENEHNERTCISVLKKHRRAKSRVHRVHVRPIVLDNLFILMQVDAR